LYVTAAALSAKLTETDAMYRAGGFTRMTRLKPYKKSAQKSDGGQSVSGAVEYPEMIYDGPFSDSLTERPYKTLEGVAVLTEPDAAAVVKTKIPYRIDAMRGLGQSACPAKCYEYELETEAGTAYVSASMYGGQILNFDLNRPVSAAKFTEADARAAAGEYARDMGFDAEPVWYNTASGAGVVVLAPVKDGVTFYTDLVKVKVALDDGGLLGVETKAYCQNNCPRENLTAAMTPAAAKSLAPQGAEVSGCKLAVIPTPGGGERLCYELTLNQKGLDYLVYVDAATGKEAEILRVIDSPTGKVVY
jgi:germination protein YpeB